MQYKVIDLNGKEAGNIELKDMIFNVEFKPIVVKEVIECQNSNARQATYGTKNRSELTYSTKKLRRQKGSGRARVGPRGPPHHRHGAVCFGPDGRKYEMTVPKTKRNKALAMCLSQKLKNQELVLVDNFEFKDIKTKEFIKVCERLNLGKHTLFIDGTEAKNLFLSMRNVPCYNFLNAIGMNPLSIVKSSKLVMTRKAIEVLEARYETK